MSRYPFPDRVQAREELKKDVLYQRIPLQDREQICNQAWDKGVSIFDEMAKRYPGKRIFEMAKLEGVKFIFSSKDMVNGSFRTFGEYYTEKNEMILYTGAIAKWAESNRLARKEAEELIMAHEFYHFLECSRIGMTSDMYQIPVLKIGKWSFGKSGVRALSEIAAHGFSRAYFEMVENDYKRSK